MTEWIVALAVFLGALALLPMVLRQNRKARRKGTAGGVMMGLGLAFMTIFDPARAATVEEVRRREEIGEEDEDSGAPPA